MLQLQCSFLWCWNLDISESTPETTLKVLKYGAGEERRKQTGLIVWEMRKYYTDKEEKEEYL